MICETGSLRENSSTAAGLRTTDQKQEDAQCKASTSLESQGQVRRANEATG